MADVRFPDNFLWGSATSSHQVEGDNTNNDWWAWEKEGRVKEASGAACDQYNRYRDDIKLAAELGHKAHRFSLEWSRIEPKEGRYSDEAMRHYKDVIGHIKSAGMEPVVTINHFTLPLWFYKKGGWLCDGAERSFAALAERVAGALGEGVRYWITINEPIVYAYASYLEGSWPPGHHSFKDATGVFISLLKAHCLAYKAIHGMYGEKGWPAPMVSISKHVLLFAPCRGWSLADALSKTLRYYYFNKLFIEALIKGRYFAPGASPVKLPAQNTLDYIGLNYYTRDFVHYAGLAPPGIFGDVCTYVHDHVNHGRRNYLKWEIYPEGMYQVLMECAAYNLPIFITENGICTDNDRDREDYIKEHLAQVARAIHDGADVIGYLYWSLLDNFEWAHGYGPRFGLIDVDYLTQERRIKPSARLYSTIIKHNKLWY